MAIPGLVTYQRLGSLDKNCTRKCSVVVAVSDFFLTKVRVGRASIPTDHFTNSTYEISETHTSRETLLGFENCSPCFSKRPGMVRGSKCMSTSDQAAHPLCQRHKQNLDLLNEQSHLIFQWESLEKPGGARIVGVCKGFGAEG